MSYSPVRSIQRLGFPWETGDPFLFCVYHEDHYPAGNEQMGPAVSLAGRPLGQDFQGKDGFRMYHGREVPGFPAHPHRGFETVTIARQGFVDHSDSLGAAGRFGKGDVQWMTAGKGVQHCEMFPLLNRDQPNPFEIFQIWLNLPASGKMAEPHFAMLWAETIPTVHFQDETGREVAVTVVAGSLGEVKGPTPPPDSWAADPANEVAIWTLELESGVRWKLPPASAGLSRRLYLYKGRDISLHTRVLLSGHFAELDSEAEVEITNGGETAHLLLLQGRPIGEPVVQYGPFVMNTQAEIREAMMEFQQTQFGCWPWPRPDHVHPRERGRFALYADGQEAIPS